MKKVFLFMLILMSVFTVTTVRAQSTTVLTGKLTNVTMNSKTYNDVENVSFLLIDNGDGTGTLTTMSDIGPIGKMPGSISINMSVKITNGELSVATPGEYAGKLNLKIGGSIKLYASSLTGTSSQFVLDTYALQVLGYTAFNASVTFEKY